VCYVCVCDGILTNFSSASIASQVRGLVVSPTTVFISGYHSGVLDFGLGNGPITTTQNDAYVLALNAVGLAPLWAKQTAPGSVSLDWGHTLAYSRALDELYWTGYLQGSKLSKRIQKNLTFHLHNHPHRL